MLNKDVKADTRHYYGYPNSDQNKLPTCVPAGGEKRSGAAHTKDVQISVSRFYCACSAGRLSGGVKLIHKRHSVVRVAKVIGA